MKRWYDVGIYDRHTIFHNTGLSIHQSYCDSQLVGHHHCVYAIGARLADKHLPAAGIPVKFNNLARKYTQQKKGNLKINR